MENIFDLITAADSRATAILAPDMKPLTYGDLVSTIDRLAGQLRALGIARGDRVAIVLPNGPQMAITYLAVASCSTAAPLNPKYREKEFKFYMDDLGAKALITLEGDAEEAHAAARDGTLRISSDGDPRALNFRHEGTVPNPAQPDFADADDEALVLHTSGTTSRPKIVPLKQRNIMASAGNIVASLALTCEDRCLNVMPLFHIHGLMAGLLSPLASGGSVACTPGFDAFKFFDWLAELDPTWYTAVPTMHQVVLSRARRYGDVIERSRLRFIRSSSASMPKVVIEDIQRVFGVPLIEAYGMTEATHQMASNPLAPGEQKPGSVGMGTGIEIATMNDAGDLLSEGDEGEVVIRGRTVITGYENNPDANAKAFTNGWFRTGDQGRLDEDGYLFLTGRLKEIINRGGEKISPLEVDEVLLRHPAVAQAVTFGMPHDKLGEEVAAAVVLAEGASITEGEVRDYAAEHLTDFKVPRKIVFLNEIPKGPTGKMQRIGLAERLGLAKTV
ncbi:MAG: acyl--CoA ligase [Gemmatimonadales bacterium]